MVTTQKRWALVTGGGRRVGEAIVRRLARDGYAVAIHVNQSREAGDVLAADIKAQGGDAAVFSADLYQKDQAERLVDEVLAHTGRLDALVLSAANFDRVKFDEVTEAHWERALTLNMKAPWWIAHRAAGALKASKGAIVVVTCTSTEVPFKNHLPYVVSKGAVRQLMRALAVELAPDVRVNAVAPGTVLPPEDYPPKVIQALIDRSPLKKVGGAGAVADAVAYLCSAEFVTGHELFVDGGRVLAAEP